VVCEPAILVKRRAGGATTSSRQIWSLSRLENKLIDMRELYEEHMDQTQLFASNEDPFLEANEGHSLIGVTNIYLDALFHEGGLELEYLAPIVSQQGEVAGRLRFRLKRLAGRLPQDRLGHCEALSETSGGQDSAEEEENNNLFTFSLAIIEAVGIPCAYAQFVFCEYSTWWGGEGESDSVIVPPVHDASDAEQSAHTASRNSSTTFRFDHCRQWTVPLTEEFIDFCSDSALSIEVYGHKLLSSDELEEQHQWVAGQATRARSLADRWQELTRKVELRVDIQELNEEGEYAPVEVLSEAGGCGGVFQLRQGQQRRISVMVRPTSNQLGSEGGMLPLICDSIVDVTVGGPCLRSRLQRPLDSYQEEDLSRLRERWSEALDRRRQYLEAQIKQYLARPDKTEAEAEREQSLVEQWVHLTEERNAVLVPAEQSGVPGAPTPADRVPAPGTELHHPVLFLDLQPGG
jgi:kinesin family member 13